MEEQQAWLGRPRRKGLWNPVHWARKAPEANDVDHLAQGGQEQDEAQGHHRQWAEDKIPEKICIWEKEERRVFEANGEGEGGDGPHI